MLCARWTEVEGRQAGGGKQASAESSQHQVTNESIGLQKRVYADGGAPFHYKYENYLFAGRGKYQISSCYVMRAFQV